MDGYESVRLIKINSGLKHIPIVALPASTMSLDENNIRPVCDYYLRKPVSRKELLQTLAKFLPCQIIPHTSENKADKNESSAENSLSPEQSALLKEKFMPIWNQISLLMSNDDIIAFAEDLKSYSNIHGYSFFKQYAENLYAYAESFDIENMNREFNAFPDMIRHTDGEK